MHTTADPVPSTQEGDQGPPQPTQITRQVARGSDIGMQGRPTLVARDAAKALLARADARDTIAGSLEEEARECP